MDLGGRPRSPLVTRLSFEVFERIFYRLFENKTPYVQYREGNYS
jgi:hypothetical protein